MCVSKRDGLSINEKERVLVWSRERNITSWCILVGVCELEKENHRGSASGCVFKKSKERERESVCWPV